jgi:hypothetical protein
MRLLPLAIATVALSLSLGVSAMACEFQKSKDVVSNSPLVERLVALAAKQGVGVKTQ